MRQYLVVVQEFNTLAAFFQKENGEWVVSYYADPDLEDYGDYDDILAICDGDTEWEYVKEIDQDLFEQAAGYTRVV